MKTEKKKRSKKQKKLAVSYAAKQVTYEMEKPPSNVEESPPIV
jgi:hypothetical protein